MPADELEFPRILQKLKCELGAGLTDKVGQLTTHMLFGAPEVNHVNIILGLVQQSP